MRIKTSCPNNSRQGIASLLSPRANADEHPARKLNSLQQRQLPNHQVLGNFECKRKTYGEF
jgi:hypothetical protein